MGPFLFQLAVLPAGDKCEGREFAFLRGKSATEFRIFLVLLECFAAWARCKRVGATSDSTCSSSHVL